jgi:hypothetical protein
VGRDGIGDTQGSELISTKVYNSSLCIAEVKHNSGMPSMFLTTRQITNFFLFLSFFIFFIYSKLDHGKFCSSNPAQNSTSLYF